MHNIFNILSQTFDVFGMRVDGYGLLCVEYVSAGVGCVCCLLIMQSFRKVPNVTKIKDGQVARADLKA